MHAEVLVLGAGPGGYTAAFRAADLGLATVLIERYPTLGGVCLNVGCIPSKALLHTAEVISMAREMEDHGVTFARPKIDLPKLRNWKEGIVGKLTKGLSGLAKQRHVKVIQGKGEFAGPNHLLVDTNDGELTISFDKAIIAAGSQSTKLPIFPDHPRVLDSTSALGLPEIPGRLLVVGGGIIGLEMATVYSELGAKVTVVELTPGLMPGTDRDLIKPLERRIRKRYENVYLETGVTRLDAHDDGVMVSFEGKDAPASDRFEYVLTAIGRTPNGNHIGAEHAGVQVDKSGFIKVDSQQRTNVPHIFAIGDIVGQPMLAHKATHEGKVAAEVCAGLKSHFDAAVIPSVAYTDPEVAWVGITEEEAKRKGVDYGKGSFPWAASGRSLGLGRDEGLTKLLFDKGSGRVIGAGIVGPHAGDLIAEAGLAIEMGCDAQDIGLTIHPHPTLSETIAFSAEAYEGTITDLYVPKKK
ncbi:MAG: dihydrolipoyl dehydrogenase [Arenicellales bacterium]